MRSLARWVLLAFRIVAPGIGPTYRKAKLMETLLLARAKYLLDQVSNNVKYPTLDGSSALPSEAAALIEYLGNLGLGEDADAMRKDFIVYFAHEVRLPNTGLDRRLVEFRAKANELFGPFLKYSRPEGDKTVVLLRLIDHFDGLRITFKKLSMLSSPPTPPAPGTGADEGKAGTTTQAKQDETPGDEGQPHDPAGDVSTAVRLLNVYTNGLADERFDKASSVLDSNLTVDEKLWKIDELMPIPPTVSGEKLGKALGVSKTAVQNTSWYDQKRKGRKDEEIDQREDRLRQRGKTYERDRQTDDDK